MELKICADLYQCLALYAGIGVDVEAGRRAGFMCKFGAESNPERARKFYTNTSSSATPAVMSGR